MTSISSHVDLVVLAVYLLSLERDRSAWDTEDVAAKAFELAPSRFSWRKRTDQINLELVRVSLSDAKKPEKGALLNGSGRTGWGLTPAGFLWAERAAKELRGVDVSRTRQAGRGGSVDEQRWRRERDRVVATEAWSLWQAGATSISKRDAKEVFRIDSYADTRMRSTKIRRLLELLSDDVEIHSFLMRMDEVLHQTEESDGKDS